MLSACLDEDNVLLYSVSILSSVLSNDKKYGKVSIASSMIKNSHKVEVTE